MADIFEVKVPDIGDFADVEIIELLVSSGDAVKAEDPLITLESDKATMDVPSPADGTIEKITVAVGDRVSEGSVIAHLSPAAQQPDANETKGDSSAEPEPANPPAAARQDDEADTAGAATPAPDADTESGGRDEDGSPPEPSRRPPPQTRPPPVQRSGGVLPHASPGVRRFARELGADLTLIRGTGPKGRILKNNVKDFVKRRLAQPAADSGSAAAVGAGIPVMPEIDFSKFGEIEIQDMPRIKKISGAHLHRSWLNIPHVTHHDEADITDLEAFRQRINEEQSRSKSGIKLTLLAFAMKALAKALKTFPLFNSSLSPDGNKLIFKKYFHVGVAVDTPNGLVVPVFRDVDGKGVLELAEEMAEVSERAREGKLKPGEMQGGSMSISSLGGIGGTAFSPIVNAPEVAILGLTRNRMAPVWNGKKFVPRLMLPIDLSYDHRVIDGAEAARFVAYLCRMLADPRRLLL
ncbi:MAG: dihydrolipoyllysine-residue acetyltransferase [Proteobacteria bacterium]|nr:MAG: dihydrolipoyllysine-residue acetyltransferase [Pseudomonadota bacterium]